MKVNTESWGVNRTLRDTRSFLLMKNDVGLILETFALTQLLSFRICLSHMS